MEFLHGHVLRRQRDGARLYRSGESVARAPHGSSPPSKEVFAACDGSFGELSRTTTIKALSGNSFELKQHFGRELQKASSLVLYTTDAEADDPNAEQCRRPSEYPDKLPPFPLKHRVFLSLNRSADSYRASLLLINICRGAVAGTYKEFNIAYI